MKGAKTLEFDKGKSPSGINLSGHFYKSANKEGDVLTGKHVSEYLESEGLTPDIFSNIIENSSLNMNPFSGNAVNKKSLKRSTNQTWPGPEELYVALKYGDKRFKLINASPENGYDKDYGVVLWDFKMKHKLLLI